MWVSNVAAQMLAFAALAQVGSACMFATFGYEPCSGKVIGSIEDNGYSYGQILEQTSMEQIFKPEGILISLTPALRSQGYGAYVHEVMSKDGYSGYLSHVTIHQGPDGHQVGGFELVKDKNGHYSNALYGCDELDDMSWFKRKPEYGGKGGWDRWGGQHPTFDINAAWLPCTKRPEKPFQYTLTTPDAPVQTAAGKEETVAEGGENEGVLNPGQLEWQQRVAQGRPGTENVIDWKPAKRNEETKTGGQEKRELSKEEIKAMQKRDFLRRTEADKTQSKPNVHLDKIQGKTALKRNSKPTPERWSKIRRSEFAGLKHAMDPLANGMGHDGIPAAIKKVGAKPTPVAQLTTAVEALQKMQSVQAWQWQKKGVAWNRDKLGQEHLTARAMVPKGPRETGVKRFHTTAW